MKAAFLARTLFVLARWFHRPDDLEIYDDHDQSKMTALWENYKSAYGKSYESAEEESFRQQIWKENIEFNNWHNLEYALDLHTHTVGLNQFSDWANDEFTDNVLEERPAHTTSSSNFDTAEHEISKLLPSHIDWRERGAVTPVQDQGLCGSCWAFSAIGSLQGQYFKKYGQFAPDLSEQNLVDCSVYMGCNGSMPAHAFQYIKERGVDKEECYPYEAKNLSCRYDSSCVGARISGYKYVHPSERGLQHAVATVGPISVCVDTNSTSWHNYKSGVFYDKGCSNINVNHAVLVVGYGTENGNDYWLVKNSWATTFGDEGYIKMSRNRGNNCAIANFGVYPIL